MLNLAVHAIMKHLGGEAMEVDEEDNLGLLRLARVGPKFAIVERFGDRAKNRPPGFALYRIAEERGGAFKIDPQYLDFVLQRQHFRRPVSLAAHRAPGRVVGRGDGRDGRDPRGARADSTPA